MQVWLKKATLLLLSIIEFIVEAIRATFTYWQFPFAGLLATILVLTWPTAFDAEDQIDKDWAFMLCGCIAFLLNGCWSLWRSRTHRNEAAI